MHIKQHPTNTKANRIMDAALCSIVEDAKLLKARCYDDHNKDLIDKMVSSLQSTDITKAFRILHEAYDNNRNDDLEDAFNDLLGRLDDVKAAA